MDKIMWWLLIIKGNNLGLQRYKKRDGHYFIQTYIEAPSLEKPQKESAMDKPQWAHAFRQKWEQGILRNAMFLCHIEAPEISQSMWLIESMMELRPRQGNLRLVFRSFCLMHGWDFFVLVSTLSLIIFLTHILLILSCACILPDWKLIMNLKWNLKWYITSRQFQCVRVIQFS